VGREGKGRGEGKGMRGGPKEGEERMGCSCCLCCF
jgi:hypothetical protein